jgi:hypothetical protein
MPELAMEVESVLLVGRMSQGQPFAAENAAQHPNGKEEATATRNPAGTVERESTGRDQTVHMRMVQEGLSPGVQDGQKADARSEMVGIGRDFEQRLGGRAEECGQQCTRILEQQRRRASRNVNTT